MEKLKGATSYTERQRQHLINQVEELIAPKAPSEKMSLRDLQRNDAIDELLVRMRGLTPDHTEFIEVAE